MSAERALREAPTCGAFPGFAAAAGAVVRQLNRQLPGAGLWLVTHVVDDRQIVVASAGEWAMGAPAGTEYSWEASFCGRMARGAPSVSPDISSEPAYRQAAAGRLGKVRAYMGVPLVVGDGELFGTLCALSGTPHPARWVGALPSVSLMGQMLSTVLTGERAARDRSEEAAHAYALAERDPLTELRNRRGFEQAVRTEEGRGQRFGTRSSVVVLALRTALHRADGFSDADLLRCAEVLTPLLDRGDVAARTTGAEFALLAVETDLIGARARQARVRKALLAAGLTADVGGATRRVGEDLVDTWTRAQASMRVDQRRRAPRTRQYPAGDLR